jgi:hypothetical protein
MKSFFDYCCDRPGCYESFVRERTSTWNSQPLIAEKQGTVGSVTKNAIACSLFGDPHVVVAERLLEEPLGPFAPASIQHCTIRCHCGHELRRRQAIHELGRSLKSNEIAILHTSVRGFPVIAVKNLHFWWLAETENALKVALIIDPGATAARQDAQ